MVLATIPMLKSAATMDLKNLMTHPMKCAPPSRLQRSLNQNLYLSRKYRKIRKIRIRILETLRASHQRNSKQNDKKGTFKGSFLSVLCSVITTVLCKRTAAALRISGVTQVTAEKDHLMMGCNPSVFRKLLFEFPFNGFNGILFKCQVQSSGNPGYVGIHRKRRPLKTFR